MEIEPKKDIALWQIAKQRAAFKIGFFTYVAINCLLLAIWYFTSGPNSYFWPIWPILGWGLGIVLQYLKAYHATNVFSAEKEYKKLKQQQEN